MKPYIQQGDVLLIPAKLPTDNRVKKIHTPILQIGEATGHAHRIDGPKYMIHELWGARYLELKRAATLRHEEHKPIRIARGVYEIRIVQEFDHFKRKVRRVRD